MNIANIYRSLKQILKDGNIALVNKGLGEVDVLNKIPSEIEKLGEINRLPYILSQEIIDVTEDEFNVCDSIKDYAFNYCTNLTNVTIPDSVTSIGMWAFANCENLTSLIIPSSVTNIGDGACVNNPNLNIYIYSTNPPILNSYSFVNSSTLIHVPVGSGDTYKTATNWSNFANNIVEDIVIE